jgi:hypothetical protein
VKERPSSGRAMTWAGNDLVSGALGSQELPRVVADVEDPRRGRIAARAADQCEGQPGAGGVHELGRGRGGGGADAEA